ncbi:hypothetical protein ACFE04_000533 [Oxalis oulophora]
MSKHLMSFKLGQQETWLNMEVEVKEAKHSGASWPTKSKNDVASLFTTSLARNRLSCRESMGFHAVIEVSNDRLVTWLLMAMSWPQSSEDHEVEKQQHHKNNKIVY